MEKGCKNNRLEQLIRKGRIESMSKMIDVSDKDITLRTAVASGEIFLKKESIEAINSGTVKKGDVLNTAKVAAIQAVKGTPNVIPMCHPIPIEYVNIEFEIDDDRIISICTVKAHYKTGVEMEALTGVSLALLTVWDMVKYLEKDEKGQYPFTKIENIKVVEKRKVD
jgi:cyclic pyranopterin phosphate synthase